MRKETKRSLFYIFPLKMKVPYPTRGIKHESSSFYLIFCASVKIYKSICNITVILRTYNFIRELFIPTTIYIKLGQKRMSRILLVSPSETQTISS